MVELDETRQRDAAAGRDGFATAAVRALDAWGLADAAVEPLAAGVHHTFRVDDAQGERWVLRLYGAGRDVAEVRAEHDWLAFLAARGVAAPRPRDTQGGAAAVAVETPAGARPAALFAWLPGEPVPAPPDAAACRRCGELMARLHRAAGDFAPPPEFSRPRYDADGLLGAAGAPLPTPPGSPLGAADGERYAAAAAEVRRRLAEVGTGGDDFGLVHGDLQVTNLLFDHGRAGVIDFADFGWGWYLYDVAGALLPMRGLAGYAALEEAFLRGYTALRPLAAEERRRLDLFLLARALFVLRWSAENWHLPAVRRTGEAAVPAIQAQIGSFLESLGGAAATAAAAAPRPLLDLFTDLRRRGVRLWAEDGKLRFKAPAGALGDELRGELAGRKAEVLEYLRRSSGEHTAGPALEPVPRDRPLPLSFAQERLWVLDRFQPGGSAYNLAQTVLLSGDLEPALLRRALGEVVRRHEALRTVFATADEEPVQVIAPPSPVPLPSVDLSALPAAARRREVGRLAHADAHRPFDLETGPLYRFRLLRSAPHRHRLLLALHHIVSDGWSTSVLVQELMSLYRAWRRGEEARLPELPVQYADFAVWQRAFLSGDELQRQLDFWRRQLDGVPEQLDLPLDRRRPPLRRDRGARFSLTLPAARRRTVETLARRAGATPFMVLLAAFQALLAALCGQRAVAVGTPIANRNRREIEGLIGFFANTLVLPARTAPGMSFAALLAQVRDTTLAAYNHQDLPFERLVEALQPRRDASTTPLFQAMLTLQDEPTPSFRVADLELAFESSDKVAAKFDVSLALWPQGDGYGGSITYATDVFDAATVERLGQLFERLVGRAGADPAAPLGRLLAAAGDDVDTAPPPSTAPPPAPPVAQRFAEAAAAAPEAPALEVDDGGEARVLTYGEAAAAVHRLAHHLRHLGVGAETRVGLLLGRSPEAATAALAVLAAGGAYVPLDPAHPDSRLAAAAGATVVVSRQATRPRAEGMLAALAQKGGDGPPRATPVHLCLDDPEAASALAARPAAAPSPQVPEEALAYVLFTSGSSGEPKGVAVRRGALHHFVAAAVEHYGFSAGDRVLQFASTAFDTWVEEVLTALCAGAAVVLRDDDMLASGAEFLAACRRRRVSVLDLPTSYWQHVVAALEEGAELPAELRLVILGAERADPAWVERWFAATAAAGGGRVRLVNSYGPTETTVVVTAADLEPVDGGSREVPIGAPLAGVRAHVLGADPAVGCEAVAPGLPGELVIGGPSVNRGYLGRPALTAAAFVPDPFADGSAAAPAGGRLYRTGDLVSRRGDGRLEFRGRLDDQVKVRGYRIEPGEVEAVLARHPAVAAAAVVVDAGQATGERREARLVAYLVGAGGVAPEADEVLAFTTRALPPYMVPQALYAVDALPRTVGGKVDRRALARSEARRLDAERPTVAPRTPLEKEIAELWRPLLEVPEGEVLGVHDSFFDRGGNSLLATQLMSRFRRRFEVELALLDLLQNPTVAGLAELVEVARRSAEAARRGGAAGGRGGDDGDREEGTL